MAPAALEMRRFLMQRQCINRRVGNILKVVALVAVKVPLHYCYFFSSQHTVDQFARVKGYVANGKWGMSL